MSCPLTTKHEKTTTGIADTGASATMADMTTQLTNIRKGKESITIQMPTNATTMSTKEGNLPLPLPEQATKAHIVPTFTKTLISIPQVVDAG